MYMYKSMAWPCLSLAMLSLIVSFCTCAMDRIRPYLSEADYRTSERALEAVDWWKRTNYYHLYLRSFQDSDGDGNGDLRGVIQRLDYLQNIGIDTILMAPFYSSPMKDGGYDIDDHLKIHPMFGTMQDFDDMMIEIKKRNMYLIVDFVPNHTSDQHEWFKCSERAYLEPERCGKYKDYYVWVKPTLNATGQPDLSRPPNNWISCLIFEPPHWMWTFSPLRQEWYLHQFMPMQPDLNSTNLVVREEMKDIVRFWLRKGADGLRVDAILYLIEDPLFRDNPINPDFQEGEFYYHKQLHIYDRALIESLEALADWRGIMLEPEFIDQATGKKSKVLIVEAYPDPIEKHQRTYGRSATEKWADMPFGVELMIRVKSDNWSAKLIEDVALSWLKPLKEKNWPKEDGVVSPYSNWYTGNHDNSRLVDRVGHQNAITYQWVSYMLPGVPINFAGDELHQDDLNSEQIPQRTLEDGDWRLSYRAPMAWNDSEPSAGFSDTHDTWLPLPSSSKNKNVMTLMSQREQNQLKSFMSINQIRKSHLPIFLFGDLVFFNTTDPSTTNERSDVLALGRISPQYGNLLLIANCDTDEPAWVHLEPARSLYEDQLIMPPVRGHALTFNYETLNNNPRDVGKEVKLQGFALMPAQAMVIRFLMYMLGKNIEPACFTEVVEDFANLLPSRQKNGSLKGDPESA